MLNKNQWTAFGVVAQEPRIKKISKDKVIAFTVLISESANEKVFLPICAFNNKAHVLCSLAHRGSQIFVKGTFRSKTKITSVKSKTLVCLFLKVSEFQVMVREPVKVEENDFADTVALYDPDIYMEEDENG